MARKNTTSTAETAEQRRTRQAELCRYLEREGVTLRQDPHEHGDLAEIAEHLQEPSNGFPPITPVEADEAAAWSILRSMRQAAGLSTYFMDYPDAPEAPDVRSAEGRTRYQRAIVTRLDGFDYGVTCQEIARDCGGTVRQAREALKRLAKQGVAEPMDDGYVLAADVETHCGPVLAAQSKAHRDTAAEARPKLRAV